MLVDTHTHIYLKEFHHDRHQVIGRAVESGVRKMFLPNIDSSTYDAVVQLSNAYRNIIFPMAGLHPTSVKDDYRRQLDEVCKQLETGRFSAVGEVGIDLYWDTTYKAQQQEAFAFQIQLAIDMNLPLVVHMRNSFDEVWEVLNHFAGNTLSLVLHCFSGTMQQALMAVDKGYYLGIGGVLTYKKSQLREVVKAVPLHNLLLETDAPYLAPVPYRGKRNEPAYLHYIAKELALLKETSIEEVERITTHNALLFFKQ